MGRRCAPAAISVAAFATCCREACRRRTHPSEPHNPPCLHPQTSKTRHRCRPTTGGERRAGCGYAPGCCLTLHCICRMRSARAGGECDDRAGICAILWRRVSYDKPDPEFPSQIDERVVGREGLEPSTNILRVYCSSIELAAH